MKRVYIYIMSVTLACGQLYAAGAGSNIFRRAARMGLGRHAAQRVRQLQGTGGPFAPTSAYRMPQVPQVDVPADQPSAQMPEVSPWWLQDLEPRVGAQQALQPEPLVESPQVFAAPTQDQLYDQIAQKELELAQAQQEAQTGGLANWFKNYFGESVYAKMERLERELQDLKERAKDMPTITQEIGARVQEQPVEPTVFGNRIIDAREQLQPSGISEQASRVIEQDEPDEQPVVPAPVSVQEQAKLKKVTKPAYVSRVPEGGLPRFIPRAPRQRMQQETFKQLERAGVPKSERAPIRADRYQQIGRTLAEIARKEQQGAAPLALPSVSVLMPPKKEAQQPMAVSRVAPPRTLTPTPAQQAALQPFMPQQDTALQPQQTAPQVRITDLYGAAQADQALLTKIEQGKTPEIIIAYQPGPAGRPHEGVLKVHQKNAQGLIDALTIDLAQVDRTYREQLKPLTQSAEPYYLALYQKDEPQPLMITEGEQIEPLQPVRRLETPQDIMRMLHNAAQDPDTVVFGYQAEQMPSVDADKGVQPAIDVQQQLQAIEQLPSVHEQRIVDQERRLLAQHPRHVYKQPVEHFVTPSADPIVEPAVSAPRPQLIDQAVQKAAAQPELKLSRSKLAALRKKGRERSIFQEPRQPEPAHATAHEDEDAPMRVSPFEDFVQRHGPAITSSVADQEPIDAERVQRARAISRGLYRMLQAYNDQHTFMRQLAERSPSYNYAQGALDQMAYAIEQHVR